MNNVYVNDVVFALGEHKRAIEDVCGEGSRLQADSGLTDALP